MLMLASCAGRPEGDPTVARPALRVLTLDLNHGMGTDTVVKGSAEAALRGRLGVVAALLRREAVDVAAFQEASPSLGWSEGLDTVEFLSEKSGLPHWHHGMHVPPPAPGLGRVPHGTALVSRHPLTRLSGGSFVDYPAESSGFVVAAVVLAGREIDVVSVDLGGPLSALRLEQMRAMVAGLRARGRPLVVLGDMNCAMLDPEKTLRELSGAFALEAWRADDASIATFPAGRPTRRLDWILTSPELEIRTHRVLPDLVSDHRAVLAEIGWRP